MIPHCVNQCLAATPTGHGNTCKRGNTTCFCGLQDTTELDASVDKSTGNKDETGHAPDAEGAKGRRTLKRTDKTTGKGQAKGKANGKKDKDTKQVKKRKKGNPRAAAGDELLDDFEDGDEAEEASENEGHNDGEEDHRAESDCSAESADGGGRESEGEGEGVVEGENQGGEDEGGDEDEGGGEVVGVGEGETGGETIGVVVGLRLKLPHVLYVPFIGWWKTAAPTRHRICWKGLASKSKPKGPSCEHKPKRSFTQTAEMVTQVSYWQVRTGAGAESEQKTDEQEEVHCDPLATGVDYEPDGGGGEFSREAAGWVATGFTALGSFITAAPGTGGGPSMGEVGHCAAEAEKERVDAVRPGNGMGIVWQIGPWTAPQRS